MARGPDSLVPCPCPSKLASYSFRCRLAAICIFVAAVVLIEDRASCIVAIADFDPRRIGQVGKERLTGCAPQCAPRAKICHRFRVSETLNLRPILVQSGVDAGMNWTQNPASFTGYEGSTPSSSTNQFRVSIASSLRLNSSRCAPRCAQKSGGLAWMHDVGRLLDYLDAFRLASLP